MLCVSKRSGRRWNVSNPAVTRSSLLALPTKAKLNDWRGVPRLTVHEQASLTEALGMIIEGPKLQCCSLGHCGLLHHFFNAALKNPNMSTATVTERRVALSTTTVLTDTMSGRHILRRHVSPVK